MNKIAVLIPCYNESLTIRKVVEDYKTALPEADIYVYDNNSTDHTDEIAREAGAIVRYEYRQGKGNVIRSMFRDIDADCYLMIDGDDTYPAENAREMVNLVLEKGVDMVVGDRLSSTYFTENKRPFHNFGNRIVRDLINKLFHNDIRDIETEMTIHAVDKNFLIEEIPVTYRDRPAGSESKLNTFSDGFKVLKTIASLFKEYKPFHFFSWISGILWIIALVFFVPVLLEYFKTGLVRKFPTVIVCGVTATIGSLMWICGVILDVIVKKHRQLYELELNQLRQAGVGKRHESEKEKEKEHETV